VGAGCWLPPASCPGAVSWEGADSRPPEDSWPVLGGELDSGAACGGCNEPPPAELLPEELPAWFPLEVFALAAEAAEIVLPGNAWAATSASTPVSATLPAISQRLTRVSLRRAASRAKVFGMQAVLFE
jgi:hypothetical protein